MSPRQQSISLRPTKVKAILELLCLLLILNSRILGLIWRGRAYFVVTETTIFLPDEWRQRSKSELLNAGDPFLAPNEGGGHWGLRYCRIGPFFLRYFWNFNLELRYCGIFWTCGILFVSRILGGIKNYRWSPGYVFRAFSYLPIVSETSWNRISRHPPSREFYLKRDRKWLWIDQQFCRFSSQLQVAGRAVGLVDKGQRAFLKTYAPRQ